MSKLNCVSKYLCYISLKSSISGIKILKVCIKYLHLYLFNMNKNISHFLCTVDHCAIFYNLLFLNYKLFLKTVSYFNLILFILFKFIYTFNFCLFLRKLFQLKKKKVSYVKNKKIRLFFNLSICSIYEYNCEKHFFSLQKICLNSS